MEYLGVILKAFATFAVTAIYNKIISIFRKRHLYSTIHTILDNYDRGEIGHTFTLVLGNAGKDKEKLVTLSFPRNKKSKLISRDYTGISARGNSILIDRILPGQKINATIFLSGEKPAKKNNIPQLKSEDATGKIYFGYGREPVNTGPFILTMSFIAAVFSVIIYSTNKNGDPFEYFYKVRHWNFYEKGFSTRVNSDNFLISNLSPLSDTHPLVFNGTSIKSKIINLNFTLKNTTDKDIKLEARFNYAPSEYYDQAMEIYDDNSLPAQEQLNRVDKLKLKYMVAPVELAVESVKIAANKSYTFNVGRPLLKGLKKEDFTVLFTVTGRDGGTDKYIFHPERQAEAAAALLKILNH